MRLINLLCAVFVFDVTSAPGGVTPFLARVRAGEGWGEGLRSCYLRLRFLLAGGSPAAGYFSCFAKKSNQKKATPGSPVLRTPLRCSPRRAAAELALAMELRGLRQSSPTAPDTAALLGGSQGEGKVKPLVFSLLVFIGALHCFCSSIAFAAPYPERPLRFLIPFPPGGGADNLARIVSVSAAESLGQQIIIDNRAGAGGNIAAETVAKAAPDGYTLLQSNISHAISASLYRNLNYDLARDFVHVTQLASIPFALATHPSLGVSTVRELVAMVKAKPAQYVYASSGNGGPSHLAMEMFKTLNGVDIRHVPYKGAAAISTDLVANQVQMSFFTTAGLLPLISGGRVRPIAIASARRSALVPDLATFGEQGMPGFEATTWFGVSLPKGSPAEAVKRLHAVFTQALKVPEVRERLTAQGFDIVASTPSDFDAFVRAEMQRWSKVVKESRATVD